MVLARALHFHLARELGSHEAPAGRRQPTRPGPSRFFSKDRPRDRARETILILPLCQGGRSWHLSVVWSFGFAERALKEGNGRFLTPGRKKLLKQKKDTRNRRGKRLASDGQGRGRVHVHPGTHAWRRCSVLGVPPRPCRAVPIHPPAALRKYRCAPRFVTSANHARTAAVPPGG